MIGAQLMPALPAVPAAGYHLAVTSAAAAFNSAASEKCVGMLIQNRQVIDAGTDSAVNIYLVIGGQNVYELVPGQSVEVPCSDVNQVTLKTLSSTAEAGCIIYKAQTV
jgi:hypothetical protein